MSILKTTASWGPLFDQPAIQIVKLSNQGLVGSDRKDFIKRASANLLQELDGLREKVASDETLIHLLAIGATEDYGANRNGDGFRRVTCANYHPSFVKYARFYRNHENKNPAKSYGRVIKSAWHDPMKRVELLVTLNASDSAAKRNGGLLADREMEKLASGKEIPVSMACRVPYDVCSYCGNQAPSTDDYCTGTHQGGMCKAGGLKDNIGVTVEIDGGLHQLHADNPHPTFFDISHVYRPADRIAYVTGMLEKAASQAGPLMKSAEMARHLGVTVPYELMVDGDQPRQVARLIKLAYQLADAESSVPANSMYNTYALAFKPSVQGDKPLDLPPLAREKFAFVLRALADNRICLPLTRFIEIAANQPFEKAAEVAEIVSRALPGVYTRLLTDPNLPTRIKASQYQPSEAAAPQAFAGWAAKLAADMSLSHQHVSRRATRAALYQEEGRLRDVTGFEKSACDSGSVGKMAEEYALYKLAFLGSVNDQDPDLPLTRSLLVVQNYAD